jgi:dGTPase
VAYSSHETERWVAEPPKRPERTDFKRDRARVLHSSALRRLAAKTQVVRAGSSDFPRTRLTHSLECAQIGRELGEVLGCDPDLVDAACLAHDLGHPPFGHNGEAALALLAGVGGPLACGGFEGNAQSLRLLTRLEPKVPGAGLNLTRATLDAALKYPWLPPAPSATSATAAHTTAAAPVTPATQTTATVAAIPATQTTAAVAATAADPAAAAALTPVGFTRSTHAKYGAYKSDISAFEWIRAGAPEGRRCLEAQVMDWADDVAYSVHDLEDGLHAGLVALKNLTDPSERTVVSAVARTHYCPQEWHVTAAELETVFAEFMTLDCWQFTFDTGPASLAAAKNLTSELVGRLCRAAEGATLAAAVVDHGTASRDGTDSVQPQTLSRYDADLVVPRRQRLECALLKAVAAHYVMSREGVAAQQSREREVITELALAIERGAPATLDPVFQPAWDGASDDEERRRVIIDQVAALTDTSALASHAHLVLSAAV